MRQREPIPENAMYQHYNSRTQNTTRPPWIAFGYTADGMKVWMGYLKVFWNEIVLDGCGTIGWGWWKVAELDERQRAVNVATRLRDLSRKLSRRKPYRDAIVTLMKEIEAMNGKVDWPTVYRLLL